MTPHPARQRRVRALRADPPAGGVVWRAVLVLLMAGGLSAGVAAPGRPRRPEVRPQRLTLKPRPNTL